MSCHHLQLIPLLLTIGVAPVSAQAAGQDSVAAELLRIENAWAAASQRHDGATVGRFLAERYHLTWDEQVLTKAEVVQIINTDTTGHVSPGFSDFQVDRFDNVAIVRAIQTMMYLEEGKQVERRARFTETWLRQPDGSWLCLAGHGTSLKPVPATPSPHGSVTR